jgi:hypothetical protein
VITAFGDLQISHVWPVPQILSHARVRVCGADEQTSGCQLRSQPTELGKVQKQVYFGDFLLQLLLVPLYETPHRHDGFDGSLSLEFPRL